MATERGDGFTIVELMVAMMIMLIITVPLVTSFVLGIRTTAEAQQDVTNSADAQVVAAFFDIDVSNARTVATTSSCGAGAGRQVVLALTWQDGGAVQTVAYVTEQDAAIAQELGVASAFVLERVECGAASGSSVVARQLVGAPVLRCDGSIGCPSATPRTVSLELVEHSRLLTDTGPSEEYSFRVSATRRVTT